MGARSGLKGGTYGGIDRIDRIDRIDMDSDR
jgi:hypothetical protein